MFLWADVPVVAVMCALCVNGSMNGSAPQPCEEKLKHLFCACLLSKRFERRGSAQVVLSCSEEGLELCVSWDSVGLLSFLDGDEEVIRAQERCPAYAESFLGCWCQAVGWVLQEMGDSELFAEGGGGCKHDGDPQFS